MGNREGLRDLLLFDSEEGYGVKVQTRGDVAFSLLHYSDVVLKNANHIWELQEGDVYAHFDCAQKGIGNGSCGNVVTLDKYLIPQAAEYNCSLLFTPVNEIESGVEDITGNVLHFKVADGVLVCEGELEYGASVSVYNMGGVLVSSAMADSSVVTLPVAGQPHGSYVVVVKSANRQNVYKILL
jgi:beta-galactosidase